MGIPHSGFSGEWNDCSRNPSTVSCIRESGYFGCIAYGAEMARERVVEIPMEPQS
jgi:hypothetical protein